MHVKKELPQEQAHIGKASRVDTSRQVESHGRRVKAYRASGFLIAVLAWWSFLWCDTHPKEGPFVETPVFWTFVAVIVILIAVTVVRWWGSKAFDKAALAPVAPPAGHDEAASTQPGLIICCSGGGIKSASFCLGALERLAEDEVYQRADSVVAVSGGSYTAAAFALHRARQVEGLITALTGTAEELNKAVSYLPVLSSDAATAFDAAEQVRRRGMGMGEAALAAAKAADTASSTASRAVVEAWISRKDDERIGASHALVATKNAQSWAEQALQIVDVSPPEPSDEAPLTDGEKAANNEVPPFDLNWVPRIRRLTNYLVSSPRVRAELILQWLFGVVVALIILSLMLAGVAWLVTEIALYNGLIAKGTSSTLQLNSESRNWLRFLIPAIPLLLAPVAQWAAHFIVGRAPVPQPWRPSGNGPVPNHGAELRAWLPNLPVILFKVGCLYVLAVLVIPVAAGSYQALANGGAGGFLESLYTRAAAIVLAVGAYIASIRSAFKGFRPEPAPDSVVGQAITFVRQQIAPVLAIAIFILLMFVALALMSAFLLSEPFRPHPWWLGVGILGGLLIFRLIGKGNLTSLYPFYRDRLSAAYLSDDDDKVVPLLSWLEEVPGEPRLVLCATANVRDEGILPTGRFGTPFILGDKNGTTDRTFTGSMRLLSAKAYDEGMGKDRRLRGAMLGAKESGGSQEKGALTLADAVAISGAALAPVVGRETRAIGRFRLLLALANIRLGVWLPNPYWLSAGIEPDDKRTAGILWLNNWLDRSSLFQVVEEAVGTPSLYSPKLYVTDGGHFDNLGLAEALRRRPERIIMLDGSGDEEDAFPAMGMAIATARIDLDVDVEFDPTPMIRGTKPNPPRAWVLARAIHRDTRQRTDIIYIKSVLPSGLSWDLDSYQRRNPGFPATTQKYETFDEFDFEAFRQLGWSITGEAIGFQTVR
jgi:hypothetical protein